MGTNEKEKDSIEAMRAAQNSANEQSAANVVTFKKFFGPKMEALTDSIDSASRSSSFLSRVLIGVTLVGTIIAGLGWYQGYSEKQTIKALSTQELRCAFEKSLGKSDIAMLAAIELCERELVREQTPNK